MDEPIEHTFLKKEHTEIPDRTFPINIFHLHYPEPKIIPLHWHDHLEWIIITRGSYRVQVGSQFHDLYDGDMVFVNAKQIHSAFPESKESELYAIVFNEALLRNSGLDNTEKKYILPLLTNDLRIPTYYLADQPESLLIQECLKKIIANYVNKPFGYELLVKSHLFESLGHAFNLAEVPSNRRDKKSKGVIDPVLLHLSHHFHEPLSIEEAAKICCISPNYFCHVFKKSTGKTLTEYINMLRIHEAERLLRTNSYTIQQIAHVVGYTNLTYFGRVFKKFKNATPSEFIK